MDISYRRFVASDGDDLVQFLTGDTWPFHAGGVMDQDTVRQRVADGFYENEDNRTFWVTEGDVSVGLIRLMDLADDTPMFDLRIRAGHRGRGLGGEALTWLTRYLFTEFPGIRRIEGTTRQDNHAMRRTFLRCGYAKEAHYRDAWPGDGQVAHDAVGYAVLRRDWESGTVTLPDWNDEQTVGVRLDPGMDSALASAAALLGQPLTDPVDLGGSTRSTVLRARTGDGGSVVIKRYADTAEAAVTFTAEASGLALTDFGPRLLAADPGLPMIVMNDLGAHPSLADLLLGDQPEAAVAALREWATAYGRLAAATAGRQEDLARLAEKYRRPEEPQGDDPWYLRCLAPFLERVAELGVAVPSGLNAELEGLSALTTPDADRYPAFSPGDICPDNNLLTPEGFKVLDFESASFHSLFLDAAYARMPFATCWCVFRLPPGLARAVEECYRAEVVGTYPDLADDLLWRSGVRSAVALWTVFMSRYLLEASKDGDRKMGRRGVTAPSLRQVLRYRWSSLLEELEAADELPALAQCLRDLLGATADWQVEPLPLYPAFRR